MDVEGKDYLINEKIITDSFGGLPRKRSDIKPDDSRKPDPLWHTSRNLAETFLSDTDRQITDELNTRAMEIMSGIGGPVPTHNEAMNMASGEIAGAHEVRERIDYVAGVIAKAGRG